MDSTTDVRDSSTSEPTKVAMKGSNGKHTGECKCAGVQTSFGGSNCNDRVFNGKSFCYVQPGACADGARLTAKYGVAAVGLEWSYKVCEDPVAGSGSDVGVGVDADSEASTDTAASIHPIINKPESKSGESPASACKC
jgi:hypothetical protein